MNYWNNSANYQWCADLQVRDQDVPVKRNYARIIINVSDTNDHTPWFTSPSYEGRVYESAAVGSAVLQVTALDKDKGKNAEIVYSIESGIFTFLHFQSTELADTLSTVDV